MNSREIIIKILYDVLFKKSYSNITLNKYLDKYSVNSKDKGFITEIVYGTIKYKLTIDTILKHYVKNGLNNLDPMILNILRMSIYQIKYLDKVPNFAVVNEAVNLSKKYSKKSISKFVNGVLRNYLRNTDANYCKNNYKDKLCFKYSFPRWMVDLFIKQYGEDSEKILDGLNKTPYVTVRINNLKTSFDDVYEGLIKKGYDVCEGLICPEALNIIKGESIKNNPYFKDGCITVQDESAMLVAECMDIKDNLTVFDLCSAPGGKATHIAEIMNNTGQIYCFDIYENKLKLIKDNAKRLGILNIKTDILDSTKLNLDLVNKADRVLIDVPCSGLGIIRKKPEIKWNKEYENLEQLICIQRKIMVNASKYLKKDGILLYSTCTLNKKENIENVEWFLKQYPEFKVQNISLGNSENIIYDEKGYITILPNKFMDGFFIAKLKKQW